MMNQSSEFGADPSELMLANPNDGALLPFASGYCRAKVVIALLLLGLFLSALSVSLNIREFRLMARINNDETVTGTEMDTNETRQMLLGVLTFFWYLGTVVAFCMWIHRAHRNLPALGAAALQFSPAGAVGWYFVPLLNLFKPYQVMREIYNASDPRDAPLGGDAWRGDNAPAMLKAWWLLFLLMGVFGNSAARLSFGAESPADFQAAAVASAVEEVITVLATLPAMWLVWRINQRQEERAATLANSIIVE